LTEPPDEGCPVANISFEPLFEKVQKDSSQELPQVETASGQDGIDLVTIFTLEIVAVHSVDFV